MRIVDLYDDDICYCGSNGEYDKYNIPPDIEPCHNLLCIAQGMQNIMDRTYGRTEPFSADDYTEMQSFINKLKYLIYQE
jgi:hypothetical protein